ncbi:flavin reductase family protein [Streptomyces blattellae]|uniref:flavin reductase family protein n=1 Tax=Streptomyces blattellae TaxID=2569855 RepID=UPI001E5A5292|nr:flavin reductase family protein [Streptomyces blattellae]
MTLRAEQGSVMGGYRTFDPHSHDAYRHVLGRVPTSVAIVTSMHADEPVGVSVGSFSSVSMDPPLVGFFIAKSSTTWPFIEPTGGFCVSVLSSAQQGLSRLFATRGADKFAGCTWRASEAGRPIIDGSVAWMECAIESISPAGDHQLVLGRVESMGAVDDADPLTFLGGRYGRIGALADHSPSESWD